MALVGVFPPARSFVRWLQARVWSAGSKSSSSSATFGMCDTHTRTHGCGVGLAMEADGWLGWPDGWQGVSNGRNNLKRGSRMKQQRRSKQQPAAVAATARGPSRLL